MVVDELIDGELLMLDIPESSILFMPEQVSQIDRKTNQQLSFNPFSLVDRRLVIQGSAGGYMLEGFPPMRAGRRLQDSSMIS